MRALIKLISVLALALIGGFAAFVLTLPRENGFDETKAFHRLDGLAREEVGIVVFTGGNGERIARGLTLYGTGVADRMLISGTHPQVTKSDLATTGDFNIIECCVDLGPRAQTTVGNALEARDWIRGHDYRAVLLVTSEFHLPRAAVELSRVAPDLVIVKVPVESHLAPAAGWYGSPKVWNTLGREYLKYLLSWGRSLG